MAATAKKGRRRASPDRLPGLLSGALLICLTFSGTAGPGPFGPVQAAPLQLAAEAQDAYAIPADEAAEQFLNELGERAIEELTDGSISQQMREEHFRSLLAEAFDFPAIGRFVLGPFWREASDTEQQNFLAVFQDAMVQRFLPMFENYSGETFRITETHRDEANTDHMLVTTLIERDGGEQAEVTWRLRQRDSNDFRILDINAEGVSMAITLRQEYRSVLRQKGVQGLIEILRDRVDAGAFRPKG